MRKKIIRSPKFGMLHTTIFLAVWVSALVIIIHQKAQISLLNLELNIVMYPLFVIIIGLGFLLQGIQMYDIMSLSFFRKIFYYFAIVLCGTTVMLNLYFRSLLWLIPYGVSLCTFMIPLWDILKNKVHKDIVVSNEDFRANKIKPLVGRLSETIVIGQIVTFVVVIVFGEMMSTPPIPILRALLCLPIIAIQNIIIFIMYKTQKLRYDKNAVITYSLISLALMGLTYFINAVFFNEIYRVMRIIGLTIVFLSNLIYIQIRFFYNAIETQQNGEY